MVSIDFQGAAASVRLFGCLDANPSFELRIYSGGTFRVQGGF